MAVESVNKRNYQTVVDDGDAAILSPLDHLKWLDDPGLDDRGLNNQSLAALRRKCESRSGGSGSFANPDPSSACWGDWGRSEMAVLRSAAINSKNVYVFCFVSSRNPISACVGAGLVLVCLTIQIAIPLSIIVSMQTVEMVDAPLGQVCPQRSDRLVKFFAVALSAYFVTLTIGLCTNKLRGLNFLRNFVNLGPIRRFFIKIGIAVQMVGIILASLAQYLLFIGNADNYAKLLLQSLAMQFCLEADMKIVSHQLGAWTSGRLKAVSADKYLAFGDGGLGEPGAPMPSRTLTKLNFMVQSEKIVIMVFLTLGVFLSASLAVCM